MDKVKRAIEDILAAGLSIAEHDNNSLKGKSKVNHLSIIGGKRRVEYYPTTGTVFANKTETQSSINSRNSSVQTAIHLAKEGKL